MSVRSYTRSAPHVHKMGTLIHLWPPCLWGGLVGLRDVEVSVTMAFTYPCTKAWGCTGAWGSWFLSGWTRWSHQPIFKRSFLLLSGEEGSVAGKCCLSPVAWQLPLSAAHLQAQLTRVKHSLLLWRLFALLTFNMTAVHLLTASQWQRSAVICQPWVEMSTVKRQPSNH